MNDFEQAWSWYQATRMALNLVGRLASHHWDDLPWGGRLGRDDQFRMLEGPEVLEAARLSRGPLDDLAIIALFAAFEKEVRARVLSDVELEGAAIKHVALKLAAREAIETIEVGSFWKVLEPFKGIDADLVEEINQVRKFRNWIAHGKRGAEPASVDPRTAYERQGRFLGLLERAAPSRPE